MGLYLAMTQWIRVRRKEERGSIWKRPGKDNLDLTLGKGKVRCDAKFTENTGGEDLTLGVARAPAVTGLHKGSTLSEQVTHWY